MNSARNQQTFTAPHVWHADWLITLNPIESPKVQHLQRAWSSADSTLVASHVEGSDLRMAEGHDRVVFFSGLLTNADELRPGAGQNDAADIVLQLLEKDGTDALRALRGPFAVIAWNHARGTLLVARDQIGLEPIYYARVAKGWLFSPSPSVLTRQAGVSAAPDAVAMSEWLCGWYPRVEDTAFRDVKRVPPATAITISGENVTFERYWDPAELEQLPRLTEDQLSEFQPLFERVVARSMKGLPPAIFLSGGLDSISVAVAASDVARWTGTAPPLALSLGFPDRASNEENVQRGVAEQLGLEQVFLPLTTAVGPRGLLQESLALSADWPLPCGLWTPAYLTLARQAADRGSGVILTGRGGDEWLLVTPFLLPDLLKRGNIPSAWRLLRAYCHSHQIYSARAMARIFWDTACRPVASSMIDVAIPRLWHQRRRKQVLANCPSWIAPAPEIRRAMQEHVDAWLEPPRPAGGFYYRACRDTVLHPALTHDMEETQEFGRRCGLRVLHPYWDVDLITLLHRVPPPLLMAQGQTKSIVRRAMAQRLPGLGLEKRPKAAGGGVVIRMMTKDGLSEWQRTGGVPTLDKFEIVSSAGIESPGAFTAMARTVGGASRLWQLMSFEGWLRRRI